MTPIHCDFYQTHDSVSCPSCGNDGIADASCWYFYRESKVTLACRKCQRQWQTDSSIILDGKDVPGGKDLQAVL